jgi:hypothetical protein
MSRPNSGLEIQRDFADRFPTDFDTTLLADCIHDGLRADVELAHLCDAAGLADEAANARRESETQPVKEVWGILRHQARQRALEVVALNCAVVIEQADRWDHDAETVDAAQAEAAEWLRHHSNEAARADVLGVAAEVA